jgi:hypothetical protein
MHATYNQLKKEESKTHMQKKKGRNRQRPLVSFLETICDDTVHYLALRIHLEDFEQK